MPYSCKGILTIFGKEDTPQVGSFLPVGLDPISDGCTPNTRICISNSRIDVREIMS